MSRITDEVPSVEDQHGGNGVHGLPSDPAFYAPVDTGSDAPIEPEDAWNQVRDWFKNEQARKAVQA